MTTCDELERNKNRRSRTPDEPGRIDNRMRFRDLPSRDTVTALREYAPGSEVVIDGLVYRSAGITLNWHAPASVTDITEIQNIREAWRCRNCGSSGTSVRAKTIYECPDCGSALVLDPETRFTYLEPAGFSVDLYDQPHNDVSTQSFVPVSSPWVNAQGEWLPLVNPGLGLYRSSNDGMVFNYSSGAKGYGYALCLTCGRAEPMDVADQLPSAFVDLKTGKPKEHNRLRGAQGGDSRICEGSYNSFAVMPSLRLGHEAHTDVLELLLSDLDGVLLRDKQVAFTLAVAIRNAIARLLGIESSELGCDTKPVKIAGNSVSQAIVIFDNNASGYCSSVADMPPNKLWHNWPHPDARDRAIEAAFEFSGIEATVISRSKQDAIHARRLDFMLDNGGTVQVWFDQGCSYWQIPRTNYMAGRSWFPFEKSAEVQGEAIASADARVEGQVFPTYIFVGR